MCCYLMIVFFFFKQKTAYEMRISDWSSDVCSSDLLCREHGTAAMLVTHDMGVIAETADRVAVMYAGRIAEIGPVQDVIKHPHHPYTSGLMGAIPSMAHKTERLTQIDGAMPRLNAIPKGCAFNPRCPKVFDPCYVDRPEPMPAGNSQVARSEEHTSELQSLMRISYAVFCLKKKTQKNKKD